MSSPLVSIITPSYNSEQYLQQTIDNIAEQSYGNIEHIVVDGGSTDNTLNILEESGTRWISESDRGMYDALNKGIKMSNGEIITYLNSDDLLSKDAVSIVVNNYNKTKNEVFVGYGAYIDSKGQEMFTVRYPFISRNLCSKIKRMPVNQQSIFWSRNVHKRIGYFDSRLSNVGDFDFFIRLFNTEKISTLRKVISYFRVHDSQISKNRENVLKEYRKVLDRYDLNNKLTTYKFCYEVLNVLMNFRGFIIRRKLNYNIEPIRIWKFELI